MTLSVKRARRGGAPLLLGLAGPSKSGKTFSALRLATGLARGGPVIMLGTEGVRNALYADTFVYDVVELEPPYSPQRFREHLEYIGSLAPAAVIIDSLSHVHEGEGGLLDMHEAELTRMTRGDESRREKLNFPAWIRPKAEEALLINQITRMNCHVIVCFRAKEKLRLVKGQDPIPLGWQPICPDRFNYETTATVILPAGARGVPDLTAQGSELRYPLDTLIKPGRAIDEVLGRHLADWAANADAGEKISPEQAVELEDMLRSARITRAAFLEKVGLKSLSEMPLARYGGAIEWLMKKALQQQNTAPSQTLPPSGEPSTTSPPSSTVPPDSDTSSYTTDSTSRDDFDQTPPYSADE